MFNSYRAEQFKKYSIARKAFIKYPERLIELEKYLSNYLFELLNGNKTAISKDYNEASYLYPFWQNYPPDSRGRKPRGDQFPWIEVGEHAIGDRLPKLIGNDFVTRDIGLPTGPDKRLVVQKDIIYKITKISDSAWLFIDIKSVGPRDDSPHAVMSHNQISGSGEWKKPNTGVKNSVMRARGKKVAHPFYSSIPPLYILSDGTIAPVINVALKPVYKMLSLDKKGADGGQPLERMEVITIPNGLLLDIKPGYLKKYPGLFFPGKDAQEKNPLKMRARVDFAILKKINEWRVRTVLFE